VPSLSGFERPNAACCTDRPGGVVQPRANARQILAAVDHPGLLRGRPEHVVNGAYADGYAQQVAHEFNNAEIRAAAHQRQRDDHLTQPSLGDRYLEQDMIVADCANA
jgi:hypothetical protein